MDRDTIIDGLRMTMDLFTFDPTTGEEKDPDDLNDLDRATYDACKGALEILERLDAESDTISRVKAIEALDKRFDSIPMEQTSEILMLRKDLRELPPAQPERIRGRWTRDNACSECGCQPWFSGDIHNYNFCPNCGAKMEVTT